MVRAAGCIPAQTGWRVHCGTARPAVGPGGLCGAAVRARGWAGAPARCNYRCCRRRGPLL